MVNEQQKKYLVTYQIKICKNRITMDKTFAEL